MGDSDNSFVNSIIFLYNNVALMSVTYSQQSHKPESNTHYYSLLVYGLQHYEVTFMTKLQTSMYSPSSKLNGKSNQEKRWPQMSWTTVEESQTSTINHEWLEQQMNKVKELTEKVIH